MSKNDSFKQLTLGALQIHGFFQATLKKFFSRNRGLERKIPKFKEIRVSRWRMMNCANTKLKCYFSPTKHRSSLSKNSKT